MFPDAEEVSDLYVHINDGQLTLFPEFGQDPLSTNENKISQRTRTFNQHYEFSKLFDEISNDNSGPFENAILFFIDLTYQLLD